MENITIRAEPPDNGEDEIFVHMSFLGMLLDIHLLSAELLRKFLIRFCG
jgi:hypothetical protein